MRDEMKGCHPSLCEFPECRAAAKCLVDGFHDTPTERTLKRLEKLGGIDHIERVMRAYEAAFQTEVERYDWFNEHAAFEAGKRVRIVEEVGDAARKESET